MMYRHVTDTGQECGDPNCGQLHRSRRARSCSIVQQRHKDMNTLRT